jgi:predicted HAD superfamily Cof-like phosphohydrolase
MIEYNSIDELNRKLREADASPVNDWADDIRAMHVKFGVREVIQKLDNEKLMAFIEFRLKFLAEELTEAQDAFAKLKSLQAAELTPNAKSEGLSAADDIVDAMIDLCVVAIGTLDALSVDSYLAWRRVHGANMAKEPGVKATRPNPLGLPDLIKPEGWTAPTHSDNIGQLKQLIG